MLSYEECKDIAVQIASGHDAKLAKAYQIRNDYVFEAAGEWVGVFPVVVFAENGDTMGLWHYLNRFDLTWDDMVEITF